MTKFVANISIDNRICRIR